MKEKLEQLQNELNGNPNWNTIKELEIYFLGSKTGCSCKQRSVLQRLKTYWDITGKKQLQELNNL
jgi:hypothetical protein